MKLYAAALYPTWRPAGPIRGVLFCGPHPTLTGEACTHFLNLLQQSPTHQGRSIRQVDATNAATFSDALRGMYSEPGLFGAPPIVSFHSVTDTATSDIQKTLEAFPEKENSFSPNLIILQAGDLSKRSRLRTLFEREPDLVCILCYPLDARILRPRLRADLAPQTLEAEAEQILLEAFGTGDMPYASEIQKLQLISTDAPRITVAHVRAALSGNASDGMALFEHALILRRNPLPVLPICWAEGLTPVGLIRAALGTLRRLLALWALRNNGLSLEEAMPKLSPPAWPRDRALLEAALRAWPAADLLHAIDHLMHTEARLKKNSPFSEDFCARGLFDVLQPAPKRGVVA